MNKNYKSQFLIGTVNNDNWLNKDTEFKKVSIPYRYGKHKILKKN